MLQKEKIVQRFLKLNGDKPFLPFNRVRSITGLGYNKCRELLSDIEPIAGPKHGQHATQLYFVDDVADAIIRKGIGVNED